jgi:ferredoxin
MDQKIFLMGKWVAAGMAVVGILVGGVAYAMTPTLSLSSAGGSSVTVNVNGDVNSTVVLYYNIGSSGGTQSMTIGTTNSSGYLSTVINNSTIISGDNAYVTVDGQQSPAGAWPVPSGSPSFSQSSITLGVGQSVSIYLEGSSAPIYLASNTNSSVASAQVSGTQVTIAANQIGTTSVSLCYIGTANGCTNIGVTVQSGSVVTFSQNNLSLGVGQGSTVTVSGGNGTYTISANSNPNIASAVLSGSTITVSALALGTTNVTACDSSGNCGTLYITVNTSVASGALSFSMTNPAVSVGQTISVTVYGGSSYYVTGNSSPSIASETLNGSTLTISGVASGSTIITVCSSSNGCGTLSVNVGSETNQVTFGITSPTVALGQTMNVSLSGNNNGNGYYVSSNTNTGIVQATVSGSSISLYGAGVGSDSLVVCANSGGCSTLSVAVSNGSGTTTGTTVTTAATSTSTSQASLLSAIQSLQSQLSQTLTQIQTMETTLTQLSAQVNGTTANTTTTVSSATSSATSTYNFTEFLGVGSQNAQVTELQKYLTAKGFYSGSITGYFGTLTEEAVVKYQAAHGITQAGYVGTNTRAALNAGK